MPYFDQLFERLPNGSYRERTKPVAPDPNGHRFVRSEKTGRICVSYLIPITVVDSAWKVPNTWSRSGLINIDLTETSFLFGGGNWGNLPKITDSHNYGGWDAFWNPPENRTNGQRLASY